MAYPKRSVTAMFFSGIGWLCAGLVAAGAVALIVAGVLGQRAARLDAEGITVIGRVTALDILQEACSDNSVGKETAQERRLREQRICPRYLMKYRFVTPEGVEIAGQASVGQRFHARQQVEGPITLRYLPGQPDAPEVVQGSTARGMWIALGIGAALWLIALPLSLRHLGGIRGRLALRERGRMRQVRVAGLQPTGVKVNNLPLYRLVWNDPRGTSDARRQNRLPQVGQDITVFEDPDGKLPSVWEGDVGSR